MNNELLNSRLHLTYATRHILDSDSRPVHYRRLFSPVDRFHCIKMELLRLNRKILQLLGLCSLPEGSTVHLRMGQWCIMFLELLCFVLFFATSLLYFWEHYPPFTHCILAVGQMIADIQVGVSFISLAFQAKRIRDFYDQIQIVFDQCECVMAKFKLFSTKKSTPAHFICRQIDKIYRRLFACESILRKIHEMGADLHRWIIFIGNVFCCSRRWSVLLHTRWSCCSGKSISAHSTQVRVAFGQSYSIESNSPFDIDTDCHSMRMQPVAIRVRWGFI